MTVWIEAAQAAVHFGQPASGVTALQGVNLQIRAGERIAFVGANGSGKSTVLRLLHGLMAPTDGRVVLHAGVAHAMLFQRPYLLRLSVVNNVALGLWLRGRRWRDARAYALGVLQQLGLGDLAQRNAQQLSGGQQQRVALARAWALEPQVLLLDEPTASLDPHAKREVEGLIAELSRRKPEMTLLFSSHNLGQVKRLATRVVYLEHGQVLADLSVADFFGSPDLPTLYPEVHQFLRGEMA
jgi:tungstate transport system ATP-binding protein